MGSAAMSTRQSSTFWAAVKEVAKHVKIPFTNLTLSR
jgi:hypothetical protein